MCPRTWKEVAENLPMPEILAYVTKKTANAQERRMHNCRDGTIRHLVSRDESAAQEIVI